MDTALSCYAQPFEGRGTPWAWDLHGTALCNAWHKQSMELLTVLQHAQTSAHVMLLASALGYVGR